MDKSLFAVKNVIVQGITGTQGSFHTAAMLAAGTHIIAGTSPNKAGQTIHGIPVVKNISDISETIDASVIFVPAQFAKSAIIEAVQATIPLIICITENIPVHDMLYIKRYMKTSKSTLIGPNSPGVLLPGCARLGIIPDHMGLPGNVGIVSRSGTLTYEVLAGLTARGIGQKYVVGIGGDPIKGTGFVECLSLFESDPGVYSIVLIGEIGGKEEIEAAAFIQSSVSKPVYGYIAGHHAPKDIQLGHAGAIFGDDSESAAAKTCVMSESGAIMSESIVTLVQSVE